MLGTKQFFKNLFIHLAGVAYIKLFRSVDSFAFESILLFEPLFDITDSVINVPDRVDATVVDVEKVKAVKIVKL